MRRVLCIGELLIDFVSQNQITYEKKAGGAPANVAVAVQKMQGNAYFLGCVGRDHFGDFLRNVLEEYQVHTDFVQQKGQTTLAFVSLDAQGERSFDFRRGSDGAYQVELAALALTKDDIVHFGAATAFLGDALQTSYEQLYEAARAKHCYISFDPNYRELLIHDVDAYRMHCLHFMQYADFIKCSEEEAMLLMEVDTVEEAVEQLKRYPLVAITRGSRGTLVLDQGKVFEVSTTKVVQVDATGAGDAFVGGYLACVAKGSQDLVANIRFANLVGARTCEQIGAMEAIPTYEMVRNKESTL